MTLNFSYFRVEISKLSSSGNKNGSVDPNTLEFYFTEDNNDVSTTEDISLQKERGNIRWNSVLQHISTTIAPISLTEIVVTDGSATTEPTKVAFTLGYDRENYLQTIDEDDGVTVLEGANALKRFVARALTTNYSVRREVMVPTDNPSIIYDRKIVDVITEAPVATITAAEEAVSVTKISNV